VQSSLSLMFPSSHSSEALLTPSPHSESVQNCVHPSSLLAFPSSFFARILMSVLAAGLHVETVAGRPGEVGSHCSPNVGWRTVSPQYSNRHVALHPSPDTVLPSSHCSEPATCRCRRRAVVLSQASPLTAFRRRNFPMSIAVTAMLEQAGV
jgi:hypothetical protein